MLLAGKIPPQYGIIKEAVLSGINCFELHLEQKHLNNIEITKENIKEAQTDLEKINKTFRIISLHTPHFDKDHPEYLEKTITLSQYLKAYPLFHSNKLTLEETLEIAKKQGRHDILLENKTSMDLKSIVHNLLPGYNMALDIAHLYRASHNIYADLEILLGTFKSRIKLIHLSDATKEKDGLAIGDGDLDFATIIKILKTTGYSEPIIIEVPPFGPHVDSLKAIEKIIEKKE